MNTLIGLLFCLLLGVMVNSQGITALLWFPLGFVLALYISAQMILPLLLGFPCAISLVSKRQMRPGIFIRLLATPIVWFIFVFVALFLIGFLWPSAVGWLESNAALNVGTWMGIAGILVSPLSKKSRSDFRDDFDRSYAHFYTGLHAPSDSTPETFNAFKAASDAYDAALSKIETHTTRANHRYSILDAKRALNKASEEDYADAAAVYNEVIAACSDPADHKPYSDADLRAHTIAMDALSAAFDRLKTAFDALNSIADLYPPATALFKAYSDSHFFAARAYSNAAHCAMTSALEAQLQAAKDEFELSLLEDRAANPSEPNPVAIRAKATVFKATLAEDTAKANSLKEQTKIAEAKAEAFLTRAQSVQANAS